MERYIFKLEAIVFTKFFIACKACPDINIKQYGYIRPQLFGCYHIKGVNELQVYASGIALVSNSRIAETVCNNDIAPFEGRPDNLSDVLDTCCVVKEKLSHIIHFPALH